MNCMKSTDMHLGIADALSRNSFITPCNVSRTDVADISKGSLHKEAPLSQPIEPPLNPSLIDLSGASRFTDSV